MTLAAATVVTRLTLCDVRDEFVSFNIQKKSKLIHLIPNVSQQNKIMHFTPY